MTHIRRLPLHVSPLPGEALDSWLEALAHRHGATWGELLRAVGLTHPARPASNLAAALRPDEAESVAAATGTSVETVEAMTLGKSGLDERWLWTRGRGSRYCPDCLAETGGRWLLEWRLDWSFACLTHQRLFADECPLCAQPQRRRPCSSRTIPTPGRCANKIGDDQRCLGDLTTASTLPLPDGHLALAAQRTVMDAIRSGVAAFGVYADEAHPMSAALADIRAVANRMLRHATRDELAAVLPQDLSTAYRSATNNVQENSSPDTPLFADAEATAAGVTAAMSVLGASNIERAGAALRWLVVGSRERGAAVSATNVESWGKGTSATLTAVQLTSLGPLFRPSEQLRYRLALPKPRRPSPSTEPPEQLVRRVPSALWPEFALRLTVPGCGQKHLRAALSCAVLLVGTRLTLQDALARLRMNHRPPDVSRILQLLENHPRWPHIRLALTRLADYLHSTETPIDYARRRELSYLNLLPQADWETIRRQAVVRPGGEVRALVAADVLADRVAGRPPTRPHGPRHREIAAQRGVFPTLLTPDLAAGLQETAEAFLRGIGLGHEPVEWSPPVELLDGLDLPGPDPNIIDIAKLHWLVRVERRSLTRAADSLGTTVDVIRHLLERHPAPRVFRTCHEARANGAPSAGARSRLPRSEFLHLYQGQRRSLREIGDQLGVSRQTAGKLARDHQIAVRRPERPPRTDIDRDWLHEQYVVRQRTLKDLANETGISPTSMARQAKAHQVPLRPRGGRRASSISPDRPGDRGL